MSTIEKIKIVSVLLDVAVGKPLDYFIPENFLEIIQPGMRVEALLRGKMQKGTILEVKWMDSQEGLQPLKNVLKDQTLPSDLMQLALWMSEYYCTPLNRVIKILLPGSVRKNIQPKTQLFVSRGKSKEELRNHCQAIRERFSSHAAVIEVLLTVEKGILLTELLERAKVKKGPVDTLAKQGWLTFQHVQTGDRSLLQEEEYFLSKPKNLTTDQKEIVQAVTSAMDQGSFETFLLHGITGSGKTEVYLHAIQKTLEGGKGTVILVPEISLATQMIERLKSRFDTRMTVLHHRLSDGERSKNWQSITRGEIKIVLGARSAIFCPLPNLGLIIVDEEHESAYKNEEQPCYHGRDVAVMRGKLAKIPVILGSATPSLESFYNAIEKKYLLKTLSGRADSAHLPAIHLIDMRKEFEKMKGFTLFSEALLEGIQKRVQQREQVLLFLNRRGYHSASLCTSCGKTVQCHHCDLALTFHQNEQILSCHLCGYFIPIPKVCPACQSQQTLKYKGAGTELVEKSLHAIFPEIRTLRIDADTTRHKGSHQKLLKEFATGKADLLIGTQMIAKGLHFPEVTLVGILNADPGLQMPDFRSSENTFQLITQVAGRAGRGNLKGEVILQTLLPENSTIQHASKHHYLPFYDEEIAIRQTFCYPPFTKMVKVLFSGTDVKKTVAYGEAFHTLLLKNLSPEFLIHPLLPAGHARIKDRYRYQFLIRGPQILPISNALRKIQTEMPKTKNIFCTIDINPTNTFL